MKCPWCNNPDCYKNCPQSKYRERIGEAAEIWQSRQSYQKPQQSQQTAEIKLFQFNTTKAEKGWKKKKTENIVNNTQQITDALRAKERWTKTRNRKVKVIREKLKSKSIFFIKREVRDKERKNIVDNLLGLQTEITRYGDTVNRQRRLASLQNELLRIASKKGQREFKTEINELCQIQTELTRLQMKLENLQRQEEQRIAQTPQSSIDLLWSRATLKAQTVHKQAYGIPSSSKK